MREVQMLAFIFDGLKEHNVFTVLRLGPTGSTFRESD